MKVFYYLLPLIAAVVAFRNLKINIFVISQKNLVALLQKNVTFIVYVVVGLVLYFVVLKAIWRIFLYIAFGGLEDDTRKQGGVTAQPVNRSSQAAAPFIILMIVFVIIFLSQTRYLKLPKINLDILEHTYGTPCTGSSGRTGLYGTNGNCYTCSSNGTAFTSPINNNCSNSTAGVYCCSGDGVDGCIATGCGSMWYCSGSYYIDGQQINISGLCFPTHPKNIYSGWTGTCRQCP